MKKLQKIACLLLAIALVMGLAISASAVDITVNNATKTNYYDFYRIFDASVGSGTEVTYSVNTAYNKALRLAIVGDAEDQTLRLTDMVAYVAALEGNAEGMRTFADALYAGIKTRGLNPQKTVQAEGTTVTAAGLEPGYYLVAERVTDNSDTVSLVMLNTAGNKNITISTKEDDPTLEKWIDLGDDNLVKTTEAYLGEELNFKLVGTVSNKYANYEEYTYKFEDSSSGGYNLLLDDTLKVHVKNGSDLYDVTDDFTREDVTNNKFTLTAELKALDEAHTEFAINGDTEIIVTYTARVNSANVTNQGHFNWAKLHFENDPYNEAEGITGVTPESRVSAFAFTVTVNKTDANGDALNGAGFTLYKWDATAGEYVQYGDEIVHTDSSTFKFPKMEGGKYKLVESTVPAGYNKAADILFEIVGTYTEKGLTDITVKDGDGNVISGDGLTFALEVEASGNTAGKLNGDMSLSVENRAGTALPETGGIGTTIFYIVGGILVLAAVVLLVTKKRMVNAE